MIAMVKFKGEPIEPRETKDVYGFFIILIVGIVALIILWAMGTISNLIFLIGLLLLLALVYVKSPPFIIEVKAYEKAVIFRMGKLKGIYGPGWHFLVPFIDEPVIVDLRVRTIDVPKQEVITKDEIEVTIDAIIYYRVVDVKRAIVEVRDYKEAAVSVVYAHLRDVVGKLLLSELLSNIDKVNKLIEKEIKSVAGEWGISVDRVEIKEVKIPDKVIKAMHEKKAAAELKKAAEQQALAEAIKIDAVREAAGKLNEPALQFLYLEALKKVAEGKSSKILFPVELSKMAERIAGVTGKNYKTVESDLRRELQRFLKEESKRVKGAEKELERGMEKEVKELPRSKKHVKEFLKKKKQVKKKK